MRIPADVVHIDPWWMTWRKYCDFRGTPHRFLICPGSSRGCARRASASVSGNIRTSRWKANSLRPARNADISCCRPDGDVYVIDYGLSLAPRPDGIVREATPENSWNARVAIIDMTNADAVRWFQDLHRPVFRAGADVFKTDFGEDIPADAVFANGRDGADDAQSVSASL